jgi:hypothetical protein
MIAYAIGRLGCHVSGDGDWGVFNSAYKVNAENKIVEAADWEFHQTLMDNQEFTSVLVREYGNMDSIPHITFKGPSFLPNWFWAYNYPHNVNEVGNKIKDCEGAYCYQLTPPVFPTPLYEILACTFLFGILWYFRKKIKAPGALFGLYLIFNGLERFMIEKIRVNTTYDIFGFHPRMADHWFSKSQWSFPQKEQYEAIQKAAKGNAFKREYDELKREFYATRAYFDNTHDNMTDVWEYASVSGEERLGHATPKPLAMIERCIRSSSEENAIVIEPFLGSGTTLIAAEKTNRKCYGMEISPKYCDVIIQRWENATGQKAVLSEG